MTNSLGFLAQTDCVLMLEAGRVVERGTYEELMKREDGSFAQFMSTYLSSTKDDDDEKKQPLQAPPTIVVETVESSSSEEDEEFEENNQEEDEDDEGTQPPKLMPTLSRLISKKSVRFKNSQELVEEMPAAEPPNAKIIVKEKIHTGTVCQQF